MPADILQETWDINSGLLGVLYKAIEDIANKSGKGNAVILL